MKDKKFKPRGGEERFLELIEAEGYTLGKGSRYRRSGIHVDLICPQGHEYRVTPNKFQQGRRCSICGKKKKKNTKAFSEEVRGLVGDEYKVMSEYKNAHAHVLMKHVECGAEWKISPSNFLKGRRCPDCAITKRGMRRRWTQSQLEEKVDDAGDSEYKVLSDYELSNKKVLIKHNLCGYEWWTYPNNFIFHGSRCPSCVSLKSKGEEKIKEILELLGVKFIFQATFEGLEDKRTLAYDFYIPDYNLLIEFDGEQHYRPVDWFGGLEALKDNKRRDKIKNDYAENNGVTLLRIPYWEEDNLEEIIKSRICINRKTLT